MKKDEILYYVNKQKKIAINCLKKNNYEDALTAVFSCAKILYETNLYYRDSDLEQYLKQISKIVQKRNDIMYQDNHILFWDGFGFDTRGLAQIYLKALCKEKTVYYVTYKDRQGKIPQIQKNITDNGGHLFFIDRLNVVESIHQFNAIIERVKAKHCFFYSVPYDVMATTTLYAYEGVFYRYQINLTDHAFWLGTGCIDKCIEFRNYGANISVQYRNIDRNKLVKIPFYPIINYEKKFEGLPFKLKENQKIVFSGGALYKTLGKDNTYYKIVDYILNKYPQIVFWYAGSGEQTEMEKIINKYPKRVYLTEEREDLYQVLEHCLFYLSTYPLCGGLMYQYAALAGKIPITLRNGDVSDDILINQNKLGILFDNISELYKEIDRIITDSEYRMTKEKKVKEAVISEEKFEKEVRRLFENRTGNYQIEYETLDTKEFRKTYIDRLKRSDIRQMIVTQLSLKLFKYEPILFFAGAIHKIKKRLKIKIKERRV